MDQKLSVSVGIPAFNEEGNIARLLQFLLKQRGDYHLEKIIVASDGSTDQTNNIVNSFKEHKVLLLTDKERKGQAARQNEILNEFNGDVLVFLNADVLPVDDYMIDKLIAPFKANSRLGLVAGRIIPLKATNFFQRVINFSAELKENIASKINNGNNIYFCNGRIRAFSKILTKDFSWIKAVSEDAYSYLECKNRGLEFLYEKDAAVYYQSPENLRDHLKQSIRFIQGQTDLSRFFPNNLVKNEHHIPVTIIVGSFIKYFFKNPLLLLCYCGIFVWSLIQSRKSIQARLVWETAESSKKLNHD